MGGESTARGESRGAFALWVAVVSASLALWSPREELGPVRAWLRLALAVEGGAPLLEALCRAAELARARSPWALGWVVRAATCAAVIEAREAGRWPVWRALPYSLSLYLHPVSLAAEVLEAAAESDGLPVEVGRAAWRELARAHGVIA